MKKSVELHKPKGGKMDFSHGRIVRKIEIKYGEITNPREKSHLALWGVPCVLLRFRRNLPLISGGNNNLNFQTFSKLFHRKIFFFF